MQIRAAPQVNLTVLARHVQPNAGELAAARLHRESVRGRLHRSFDVSRVLDLGSHARSTAIRWYSDLDILVVLRKNEAKWGGSLVSSGTLMNRVLDELRERFPNTGVRRDYQAAVVSFGGGKQSLDVVPAIFKSFLNKRPVYAIPDGHGGWLETNPETHDLYFSQANMSSGGKLKRVSQLLKWWKFSRSQPIPLSSFHTDLVLASSSVCVGAKTYAQCLYGAFRLLQDRECRGLRDPCGIAGVVYACETENQWKQLLGAVDYAVEHSRAALIAESAGKFIEANRQWNIVFNGEF